MLEVIKEQSFVDKSKWDRGPWDDEPDKVQMLHKESGLDCLIVRAPLGALCGYVGVTEGHPFFNVDYGACTLKPACGEPYCEHTPESILQVHGGITFSNMCQEDREHGVCHTPLPGRSDKVFWLGFDCNHFDDLAPFMAQLDLDRLGRGQQYRAIDYVKNEIEQLAQQLADMKEAA